MASPIVSVILLTYNHEAFISQCLESLVSQKTAFPFEVIIGEDCSTDSTRSICNQFAKKHSDIIRLPYRSINLGLAENLIQTLALAKGKFITFQEGDDFYTENDKLQLQVDILDNETNIVACTHNTNVIFPESSYKLLKKVKPIYHLSDSLNGRIFHTNSWMIRKEFSPDFRQYFNHLICWDILMERKILEKGNVIYLDKTLSVWRKHDGGNSVKIPLKTQFINFESLYKALLSEARLNNNKSLINHYKLSLKNCYTSFAISIATNDKILFPEAIFKSILWQFKTLDFDLLFFPRLVVNYFRKSDK